jgi:hypothetical protein
LPSRGALVTLGRNWRQPVRHARLSGVSLLCGIETVRRGQHRSIDFDQSAMSPIREARTASATIAGAGRLSRRL